MRRFVLYSWPLVALLISIAGNATTSGFHCINGQVELPRDCSSLNAYLNQGGAAPAWTGQLNECLKGVRAENSAGRTKCGAAADRAMDLMLKVGQAQIAERESWEARQTQLPTFIDRQCFPNPLGAGGLCHSSFNAIYPGGQGHIGSAGIERSSEAGR